MRSFPWARGMCTDNPGGSAGTVTTGRVKTYARTRRARSVFIWTAGPDFGGRDSALRCAVPGGARFVPLPPAGTRAGLSCAAASRLARERSKFTRDCRRFRHRGAAICGRAIILFRFRRVFFAHRRSCPNAREGILGPRLWISNPIRCRRIEQALHDNGFVFLLGVENLDELLIGLGPGLG